MKWSAANIPLSRKNLYSFLVVFSLFAASLFAVIKLTNNIIAKQQEVIKEISSLNTEISGLLVETEKQDANALDFIATKSEKIYKSFIDYKTKIYNDLNRMKNNKLLKDLSIDWDKIEDSYSDYTSYISQIHSNLRENPGLNFDFDRSKAESFKQELTKISSAVEKRIATKAEGIDRLKESVNLSIMGLFGFVFFLMSVMQYYLGREIKKLTEASLIVAQATQQSKEKSFSVSEAATKVSKTVSSQASAIQETVATLEEIKQMMSLSVLNASKSLEKSRDSKDAAREGSEAIGNMINAIHNIDNENKNMQTTMTKSNDEISEISKMINHISEKTSVINDIVFQTKLLSFNASVEAARAGEHGKGFSVVAEEVGNLAAMSGQAASEIDCLLKESVSKVEGIVKRTQTNVEKLIESSSGQINIGINTATRCEEVLTQVSENVNSVASMIEEITHATTEQTEGVKNISLALTDIENSTHSNAVVAGETTKLAEYLTNQTKILEDAVKKLELGLCGNAKYQSAENSLLKFEIIKQTPETTQDDDDLDQAV